MPTYTSAVGTTDREIRPYRKCYEPLVFVTELTHSMTKPLHQEPLLPHQGGGGHHWTYGMVQDGVVTASESCIRHQRLVPSNVACRYLALYVEPNQELGAGRK
jgi:hypothetical protein